MGTSVTVRHPQPHPYRPKWTARLSVKALPPGELVLVQQVFASFTSAQLGALHEGCAVQCKEVLQLLRNLGVYLLPRDVNVRHLHLI